MSHQNKRTSPRFSTDPSTYVVYVEGSGAIRDLGLNGAFVVDPDPLPVGEHIQLELRLGGKGIPVHGIVRRSIPGQGMGIEFVDLSAVARHLIQAYLSRLATSSVKP